MGTPTTDLSRRAFVRTAGGVMAIGATGAARAQETATPTGTGTGAGTDGGSGTGAGTDGDGGTAAGTGTGTGAGTATGAGAAGGGQTHTIDMTDGLVFDPDSITIAPGDTIVWETVGSIGHTVTAYADEIPEDAEYFASGGFDAEQAARSSYQPGDPEAGDVASGESYEHTFAVTGEYEYFCIPHESAGMVGSVTVQEGGAPETAAGPTGPQVPEIATDLVVMLSGAGLAVLSLTYMLIKFGGDYGFAEDENE